MDKARVHEDTGQYYSITIEFLARATIGFCIRFGMVFGRLSFGWERRPNATYENARASVELRKLGSHFTIFCTACDSDEVQNCTFQILIFPLIHPLSRDDSN